MMYVDKLIEIFQSSCMYNLQEFLWCIASTDCINALCQSNNDIIDIDSKFFPVALSTTDTVLNNSNRFGGPQQYVLSMR